MKPAILRGREQTVIGAVASVAEGPCAIALSRGGAAKTYRHRDLNEDVAGFASGEDGTLVAVADGHGGCDAAEIAVDRLLTRYAPLWTGTSTPGLGALWDSTARAALADINLAVLRELAERGEDASRTTLALAVWRPSEALLLFASVGDSHVFRVDVGTAVDLVAPLDHRTAFLGSPQETRESLRANAVIGSTPQRDTRAVVAITDGISERGIGVADPAATVADATLRASAGRRELRPLTAARSAVESALAAHRHHRAGDNVACAVAWLEP